MYTEIDTDIDAVVTYHENLKKRLRNKLKGGMDNIDNVLYFPKNIDVRICPKNAMSTLKWALIFCNNIEPSHEDEYSKLIGTKGWRIDEIGKCGFRDELPFRQHSVRIAVSRDPIKRFMSACEYMKTEYLKQTALFEEGNRRKFDEEELKKIGAFSDVDPLPNNIDDVIDIVANKEINNSHFYTQTYYMGNRSQYDEIYTMRRVKDLLTYLRKSSKISKAIEGIRSNKTSKDFYGSPYDLTRDQKFRIMRIYQQDYDYGWTEEDKPSKSI